MNMTKIDVKGTSITVVSGDVGDYISLTDSVFNPVQFDVIRMQASETAISINAYKKSNP
jgi:hypothetical protein